MSLFIESIKISKGKYFNLNGHEARMHKVMSEVFGLTEITRLKSVLKVPDTLKTTLVKARITYDTEIRKIDYEPYTIRSIKKAKIVIHDYIHYPYKYADRTELNTLFAQRDDCDEIIIVKNGFVTDACNYNLIFQKDTGYFTPIKPLLNGTQRQRIIQKGIATPKEIHIDDIIHYDRVHFINALTGLRECSIPVNHVAF